jgi:hypothetical protein
VHSITKIPLIVARSYFSELIAFYVHKEVTLLSVSDLVLLTALSQCHLNATCVQDCLEHTKHDVCTYVSMSHCIMHNLDGKCALCETVSCDRRHCRRLSKLQ